MVLEPSNQTQTSEEQGKVFLLSSLCGPRIALAINQVSRQWPVDASRVMVRNKVLCGSLFLALTASGKQEVLGNIKMKKVMSRRCSW